MWILWCLHRIVNINVDVVVSTPVCRYKRIKIENCGENGNVPRWKLDNFEANFN